jgi:hypothetical protein
MKEEASVKLLRMICVLASVASGASTAAAQQACTADTNKGTFANMATAAHLAKGRLVQTTDGIEFYTAPETGDSRAEHVRVMAKILDPRRGAVSFNVQLDGSKGVYDRKGPDCYYMDKGLFWWEDVYAYRLGAKLASVKIVDVKVMEFP